MVCPPREVKSNHIRKWGPPPSGDEGVLNKMTKFVNLSYRKVGKSCMDKNEKWWSNFGNYKKENLCLYMTVEKLKYV